MNCSVRPMSLSITTRGIGLNLCAFYYNTIRDYPKFGRTLPNIYAVYRAMLALVEVKLMKVGVPLRDFELVYRNSVYLWEEIIGWSSFLIPVTIQKLIDAIGIIENEDEGTYFPVMSKNTLIDGRFVPRPENILLSNLRETVVALADPNNPVLHKETFYQNNPIPAAEWDLNYTLMNAEKIMPAEYDYNTHLDQDFRALRFFGTTTLRLNLHNFSIAKKNATGDKAILMGSQMSGLRTPDLQSEETLINYYRHAEPENNVQNFYSLVSLSDDEKLRGATMLLGEQPIVENCPQHSLYALRSNNVNAFSFMHNYKGSFDQQHFVK
ncbi:hypothetical protein PYW08_007453 [Mythimna loreyi]|uniref:Uncharacterized protein n=1 Tax=Mythimna loreyi TaxID=667449 RepID=A0ACC2QDP3_9NEOP|nr:hypothetical protein PYW08_007453 [Mythimna loreyi]